MRACRTPREGAPLWAARRVLRRQRLSRSLPPHEQGAGAANEPVVRRRSAPGTRPSPAGSRRPPKRAPRSRPWASRPEHHHGRGPRRRHVPGRERLERLARLGGVRRVRRDRRDARARARAACEGEDFIEFLDPFALERQLYVLRHAVRSGSGDARAQGFELFRGSRFRGNPQPTDMGLTTYSNHTWRIPLPDRLGAGAQTAKVRTVAFTGRCSRN